MKTHPRAKKPEPNVNYTFLFIKNGQRTYHTLRFEGCDEEKNRYRFVNVKTETLTSMPPERFSYLHRFCLVNEVTALSAEEKKEKRDNRKFIREIIAKLQSISNVDYHELKKVKQIDVGAVISGFEKELEYASDESSEAKARFNVLMAQYMAIQQFISS